LRLQDGKTHLSGDSPQVPEEKSNDELDPVRDNELVAASFAEVDLDNSARGEMNVIPVDRILFFSTIGACHGYLSSPDTTSTTTPGITPP